MDVSEKTGSRLAGGDDTVLWLGVLCFRAEWLFLKRLDHGSQAVMTRCGVWDGLFWGWVAVSKRLDHGSSP